MNNVCFAFALSLGAGLATGIGGAFAFAAKKANHKFLGASLAFSSGVMIYVSLVEILAKGMRALTAVYQTKGAWLTVAAFFLGMVLIGVIEKFFPEKSVGFEGEGAKLLKMGSLTAAAMAIHNFPEGLATFVSALQEPSVALPVAFAIAVHNIPEGIAVAIPVYYATGRRDQAFWVALVSGLTEPLGALIGYAILRPFLSDAVYGAVFAVVAGIMVYISLSELLPTAWGYAPKRICVLSLMAGMAVMAVSLVLFM